MGSVRVFVCSVGCCEHDVLWRHLEILVNVLHNTPVRTLTFDASTERRTIARNSLAFAELGYDQPVVPASA